MKRRINTRIHAKGFSFLHRSLSMYIVKWRSEHNYACTAGKKESCIYIQNKILILCFFIEVILGFDVYVNPCL